MKSSSAHLFSSFLLVGWEIGLATLTGSAASQSDVPGAEYHIYSGNTHSHTQYTWSHGAHFAKPVEKPGSGVSPGDTRSPPRDGWFGRIGNKIHNLFSSETQPPPEGVTPRPNWRKYQGPPAAHYAKAKTNGYDFYVTSDHTQEAAFQPVCPTNPAWVATKRQAAQATDHTFVALAGFEHSENNGPGGIGHLNVINSSEYLNALAPGISLPYLYKWLKVIKPNGTGPVVASFNHPEIDQFGNWAHRDPEVNDIITMLEVINSNTEIHYEGFLRALAKGWKVSPVCGNDNHGLMAITYYKSRTFVLATSKTKVAILDAMKNRRTYASLDGNIQCRYTVNGAIMGSTLKRPDVFKFNILITDPDTAKTRDMITKIDIVKDNGAVALEYYPKPSHSVAWTPTIHDTTGRFFFLRVWNAGGGDAAGGDPKKPVAWLAPVWTGR